MFSYKLLNINKIINEINKIKLKLLFKRTIEKDYYKDYSKNN